MQSPLRARATRALAAVALVVSTILPAAGPATAADPLILRVGTDQTFSGLNPWQSVYVLDYEVFTLNYDLLVGYDQNLGSAPGFAESWTTSTDGLTTTFKIRAGMKWSDGVAATAEDARWTYQLVLDAMKQEVTLGSGYIDGYLSSAGLKAVTAPDATTLVVQTDTPTALLLPAYVPILPKHVWSKYTLTQIADATAKGAFLNNAPVVGTGPYQAVEYKAGEFMRFARNKNYWGKQGAADEVIIQHFASGDTMVQALKNGEIDYARGIGADAFDALKTSSTDVKTVEGFANGYSYLTFNGYPKAIAGGGSSTSATRDPAFRDALAWAIDESKLVEKTLAGHGTPGTSVLPPFQAKWYVPPSADKQRSFDIEKAKAKLDAAGYKLDPAGKRLDKEGKAINLRLTWPSSEPQHATDAQFIKEWWGQLGIGVDAAVTEDDTLLSDLTPPEGKGKAKFDTYMWGWVGDVDPTSLLQPFTTAEIGKSSDTFFSNARFDELFKLQGQEQDETKRKAMLQEMQEIFYDQVPNIPLYYDSELHAYRTDRFSGWQNQPPASGTPLFGFGPIGYSLLTDASVAPSPSPEASVPAATGGTAATPGSSAAPTTPTTPTAPVAATSDNTTLLIVGVIVVIAIVAGLLMAMRRRGRAADEE